jgi:hypothetical protein
LAVVTVFVAKVGVCGVLSLICKSSTTKESRCMVTAMMDYSQMKANPLQQRERTRGGRMKMQEWLTGREVRRSIVAKLS